MQHKVLFMIDLPRTTAFEAYRGQVEECIGQLREKGVDVYTRINKELLTGINRYDIVIVVAHRDADETLLLADGKFPMVEFVESLPTDFAGVLDFSSCYSETVKDAIKSRSPQCHVQVASEQTRLQVRLLAYPYVVDMINSYEMDYRTAYLEVLHMFEEAAAGNPDDENYADDSVRLGEGGQKNTSVFSPLEVKCKATVPIHVFIHYDSEREVVKNKVPKNTEIHIYSESLRGVHVGDELTIRLSFIDNGETHHLRIEGPDEFKVTVEEEIIHHFFKVYVSAEYSSPNFACNINFEKGNEMISCLPVFIDVTDYDAPIDTASCKSQPNSLELDSFHPSIEEMKQYRTQNREEIIDQLFGYVDLGDWKEYETIEKVKKMLLTILGNGEVQLKDNEAKKSEDLWYLLENGRGNRVEIVWQNLVGYFDERKLFRKKGSPALNKDFFDKTDGYSNIDKGRPSRDANGHPIPVANMSKGFFYILDLLDTYYKEIFQM